MPSVRATRSGLGRWFDSAGDSTYDADERRIVGPIGIPEMIVVGLLALLIFGPRKLPELGRSLGKALTEFRRASTDLKNTIEDEVRQLERETEQVGREVEAAADPDRRPRTGSIASPELPLPAGPAHHDEKLPDGDVKPA